jgi:hypothetical protein
MGEQWPTETSPCSNAIGFRVIQTWPFFYFYFANFDSETEKCRTLIPSTHWAAL